MAMVTSTVMLVCTELIGLNLEIFVRRVSTFSDSANNTMSDIMMTILINML